MASSLKCSIIVVDLLFLIILKYTTFYVFYLIKNIENMTSVLSVSVCVQEVLEMVSPVLKGFQAQVS